MAEFLTGMADALRWKSLTGNCQDKYKGHWTQWVAAVVPYDGDAGCAAAQGVVCEHIAVRSIRGVFVSIRLEYPGTWQPAWNNRELDLGHPLASSSARRV
jgi:hypothetical protein